MIPTSIPGKLELCSFVVVLQPSVQLTPRFLRNTGTFQSSCRTLTSTSTILHMYHMKSDLNHVSVLTSPSLLAQQQNNRAARDVLPVRRELGSNLNHLFLSHVFPLSSFAFELGHISAHVCGHSSSTDSRQSRLCVPRRFPLHAIEETGLSAAAIIG